MSRFSEFFTRFAAGSHFGLHGESVVYKPRGGTPRTIVVIVNRNPPERVDGGGNVVTPTMEIEAYADGTNGIDPAAVDAHGADKVAIAERPGGPTRDFGVYVPDPSAGNWCGGPTLLLDLR